MSELRPEDRILGSLCELGPRRAGTDAERRAAGAIVATLGRQARPAIEPTYVHPQWPAVHLLHCALAVAGSLISTWQPAVGFGLALVAATSLYLDLTGRAYLLRRLLFRRASQNVIAPPIPEEAGRPRVLICAHYDSGLTGAVYNRRMVAAFERLRSLWPAPIGPMAIVFWSIALLLPALGLRMAGIEEDWVALLQLPQTLILIVAAFAFGEIGLSPPSPGANDGAAGAAAAAGAWRRLRDEPPGNLDVHLVLTGAGETTQQGLRELLRSHRRRLDPSTTYLIEIDSPGRGEPRFVVREASALSEPVEPELVGLCEALSDPTSGRAALPLAPAGGAALATSRGYRAIALTAREGFELVPEGHHTPADRLEALSLASVDAVADLAVELVRLLDRGLGRTATAGRETDPS